MNLCYKYDITFRLFVHVCVCVCVCFFYKCVSLQVKTAEDYMALMNESHFVEYENTMRMSQLVGQQLAFVVNAENETAAALLEKFGPPVPDTVPALWTSKWPLLRTVAIKFHQVFTFIISSPSVVDELNDFHSLQREKVQTADRTWTMKHNPRLASLFTTPHTPTPLQFPPTHHARSSTWWPWHGLRRREEHPRQVGALSAAALRQEPPVTWALPPAQATHAPA